MRHIKIIALLAFLYFCLATPALGWSKAGHMLTGALAYYELKARDPVGLAGVISLLKKHPAYELEWAPAIADFDNTDSDTEGLFLFMYAARWPDDIRDDPNLHCEECHYINYRFRPGQPTSNQQPPGENIVRAAQRMVGVLRGDNPASVRAMALCWIFHLTGDVHQPLHTSALFTSQFPQGDRGGTKFFIRVRQDLPTIHLHRFWDGLIQGSERFGSVQNRARNFRTRPELRRTSLPELSETRFERWARSESFEAAKQHGYRNGTLLGSTNSNNGALLPQGYASNAQDVAVRRAMLAGYRLSDMLQLWF